MSVEEVKDYFKMSDGFNLFFRHWSARTRVKEESSKKEAEVEDEIYDISSRAKGLSVCNWSIRDTDRMLSFLNAAKKMDRKLVISLKQAYLLEELSKCAETITPPIDDENIELYASRKSWGLIGSDCCKKMRDQDYDTWERSYLDRAICYKDLRDNQANYLMYCSNFDLKEAETSNQLQVPFTLSQFVSHLMRKWRLTGKG